MRVYVHVSVLSFSVLIILKCFIFKDLQWRESSELVDEFSVSLRSIIHSLCQIRILHRVSERPLTYLHVSQRAPPGKVGQFPSVQPSRTRLKQRACCLYAQKAACMHD